MRAGNNEENHALSAPGYGTVRLTAGAGVPIFVSQRAWLRVEAQPAGVTSLGVHFGIHLGSVSDPFWITKHSKSFPKALEK